VNWYYAADGAQVGPLDDKAFQELVSSGRIQPATLVWNSEMTGWKPLAEATLPGSPPPIANAGPTSFCSECGGRFLTEDMIQFGAARVCANCKERFAQKLREGVPLGQVRHYGGFWIRFLARFLDGVLFVIVFLGVGSLFFNTGSLQRISPFGATYWLLTAGQTLVVAVYEIVLTARIGGTLGKRVLGLRVITPDGAPLSLSHSAGRYFAQLVTAFTLSIGYLMAAFDSEKRALHDRIANTRVVKA
jgi:uncharacterized RDD family membrane protein YckC